MNVINRERVRNYSLICLAVYVIVGIYCVVSRPGHLDRRNNPKGGDFITFYAASIIAREGSPAECYTNRIFDVEKAVSGTGSYTTTWDYPPPFLLVAFPLSMLPYLWSVSLWLALTMLAYVLVVRRLAPYPLTTLAVTAFPGTFQNLLQGQNGFLSATLLGGGFLMLASRPFLAGCVLGLLSYKPQVAMLVIIGLLVGKQWKAIAGAAVSAVTLAAVSFVTFGAPTWIAFFKNIPIHSKLLAAGKFPLAKMPTVFGGARVLGATIPVAHALQGIITIAALIAVVWLWRQKVPLLLRASGLIVATCLSFPYLFDYDLAILAPALAYTAWHAREDGWRKGEKLALLGGWITPFASSILADSISVQIGPLLLGALLIMIMLHAKRDSMRLSMAQDPAIECV